VAVRATQSSYDTIDRTQLAEWDTVHAAHKLHRSMKYSDSAWRFGALCLLLSVAGAAGALSTWRPPQPSEWRKQVKTLVPSTLITTTMHKLVISDARSVPLDAVHVHVTHS
jgi:hypothetical protein